jgi:hypothetical protein
MQVILLSSFLKHHQSRIIEILVIQLENADFQSQAPICIKASSMNTGQYLQRHPGFG